jgi:hypothetical protein
MPDQIETITGIIHEHKSIEEQIRQALGAIEDWQITLESMMASGEPVQVESLSGKQWILVQSIDALEQGMLGHYQRVEHELLEFIGPVISKALKVQHRETVEQLRSLRLLLTGTDLKFSSITELAAKYPNVKQALENNYRLIGEHDAAEDITLRLVLRGVMAKDEDKA